MVNEVGFVWGVIGKCAAINVGSSYEIVAAMALFVGRMLSA